MKRLGLLFVFTMLLFVQIARSEDILKIEVKIFKEDIIFIFYHNPSLPIDIVYKKGQLTIQSNLPIKYEIADLANYNNYATAPVRVANSNNLLINIDKKLVYRSLINGERLEAIKFIKPAEVKAKNQTVNEQQYKNDPSYIKFTDKVNFYELDFPSSQNVKAAAFIRGKYLWVIFDDKKLYNFKENEVISKFTIVPSNAGTVMRMRIEREFNGVKLVKKNNSWIFELYKGEFYQEKANLKTVPLVNEDGFKITGDFKNSKVITFEDPEIGDALKAITMQASQDRVSETQDLLAFSILKSLMGIIIDINSEEVKFEKNDNEILVYTESALEENVALKTTNNFPGILPKDLATKTLLPIYDKNLDILNFNDRKTELTKEIVEEQSDEDAMEKLLELAKFYFEHKWYNEASDLLKFAKAKYKDEFNTNYQARFLLGSSLSIIGHYDEAKKEYSELISYSDLKEHAELNLWNNYNNYKLGASITPLSFIENSHKLIANYHDDVYWEFALAELDILLTANDIKLFERTLKELKNPEKKEYANSLKYFKANYYKRKKQYNLAKQFFIDIAAQKNDPYNSSRALFDLIKYQLEKKEIELDKALDELNMLKFIWRGDNLEYEILLTLASLYYENQDILNALRTYKYIQGVYNDLSTNFYVTSQMSGIFNDVFLPGGIGKELDDFTIVALFYEFQELNPIGNRGDKVILEIAKRLVKLDLLDSATDLLRHQIQFRLKGENRVDAANNLALVLISNGKPQEAIAVLDQTDAENFSFDKYLYRLRLRASAMLEVGKYDEILDLLKQDNSEEGEIIKKEALFKGQKWDNYAEIVNNELDSLMGQLGKNDYAAQDILRLGIAYHMLGYNDQINMLSNQVGNKDPNLKNTLDLISTNTGSIDIKNLDESLNINQFQNLLDKYSKQFVN